MRSGIGTSIFIRTLSCLKSLGGQGIFLLRRYYYVLLPAFDNRYFSFWFIEQGALKNIQLCTMTYTLGIFFLPIAVHWGILGQRNKFGHLKHTGGELSPRRATDFIVARRVLALVVFYDFAFDVDVFFFCSNF